MVDNTLRERLRIVIFETNTPAGKLFDVGVILAIAISVLIVMLDSVATFHDEYGPVLYALEWFFTLVFTVEYGLRLYASAKPIRYATSFFGVVDLLAILPTYISLVVVDAQYVAVVRVLRVLRVFRVLKLAPYVSESDVLVRAMYASRRKITVFLFSVLSVVVILGSFMYLIEGQASGFTSIPESMYWGIVTLTTVGYGDISPVTPLGKAIASFVMVLGYSIIAVPTGIVSAEVSQLLRGSITTRSCPACSREGHDVDASHCKFCGARLR